MVGRICVLGSHWYWSCLCCRFLQVRGNIQGKKGMMKYFMFNLYFTRMIILPLDQRKQRKEKSYFMFINIKLLFLAISLLCISSFGWISKVQMIIPLGGNHRHWNLENKSKHTEWIKNPIIYSSFMFLGKRFVSFLTIGTLNLDYIKNSNFYY